MKRLLVAIFLVIAILIFLQNLLYEWILELTRVALLIATLLSIDAFSRSPVTLFLKLTLSSEILYSQYSPSPFAPSEYSLDDSYKTLNKFKISEKITFFEFINLGPGFTVSIEESSLQTGEYEGEFEVMTSYGSTKKLKTKESIVRAKICVLNLFTGLKVQNTFWYTLTTVQRITSFGGGGRIRINSGGRIDVSQSGYVGYWMPDLEKVIVRLKTRSYIKMPFYEKLSPKQRERYNLNVQYYLSRVVVSMNYNKIEDTAKQVSEIKCSNEGLSLAATIIKKLKTVLPPSQQFKLFYSPQIGTFTREGLDQSETVVLAFGEISDLVKFEIVFVGHLTLDHITFDLKKDITLINGARLSHIKTLGVDNSPITMIEQPISIMYSTKQKVVLDTIVNYQTEQARTITKLATNHQIFFRVNPSQEEIFSDCLLALKLIYGYNIALDKRTFRCRTIIFNGRALEASGRTTQINNEEIQIIEVVSSLDTNVRYVFRSKDIALLIEESIAISINVPFSSSIEQTILEKRRVVMAEPYSPDPNNTLADATSLNGKSVLFIQLCQFENSKNVAHLKSKGLEVVEIQNIESLTHDLSVPDVVILISGISDATKSSISILESWWRQGVSLLIWSDDDPYFGEANTVLQSLFPSAFTLEGDYFGEKILNPAESNRVAQQTFNSYHPVSSGLISLYEGSSICYPTELPRDWFVYAHNSNPQKLQPAIFYKLPKNNEGAVWVDTGFTKLWDQYEKFGNETKVYLANVVAYLISESGNMLKHRH